MLTLDNINFEINHKSIFKNLSLSLSISSVLIINGKNGCGKSSLLKLIAGIYQIQNGKILWDNQNIENFRNDFNGDIQYIGHKNFLKSELSVYENLRFYSQLHGTEIALNSALKFFDLVSVSNIPIGNLSAGFKQRVMLAKLLACPATIWLLDEPNINLDKEWNNKLRDLIKTRVKDKGIVIVATHDENLFELGQKLNLEDYNNN